MKPKIPNLAADNNLSLACSTLAEFLPSMLLMLLSLAACHTYSLVETRSVEDCL